MITGIVGEESEKIFGEGRMHDKGKGRLAPPLFACISRFG